MVIGSLLLTGPVTAGISTIMPGNTVFIGEQGLDITAAMDGNPRIGYWAPGAPADSSPNPTDSISGSSLTSYYISQSQFGSYTGSWYRLNSNGVRNGTAFYVKDPYLDIRVEDTTVSVDVTDKWVSTDDEIRFRIDTNLVAISERGAGAPRITIKVQLPGGGVYTALINKTGTTTPIEDIPVSTIPYYTVPIWDTGNRATYPPGTYTIWAECNENGMNDNYDVTGKTISRKTSLLNQDQNPLIRANVPATNPAPPITSIPTKKITSLSTPLSPASRQTPLPTATAPLVFTATPVPAETSVTPQPSPTQTKAAGFEATLVVFALVTGLIFYAKKQ